MVKKGNYGNDGLNLAWDLGIIFLGIPNLHFGRVKKNFKIYVLKVLWKNVRVVSWYTVFMVFFFFFWREKRYYGMRGLNFCTKLCIKTQHYALLRKSSEITNNKPTFTQYNIFFTIMNISFFSLRFDLFSIIAKEVNQIRNNLVCVVAHLVFLFFCALTTDRCNASQHIS